MWYNDDDHPMVKLLDFLFMYPLGYGLLVLTVASLYALAIYLTGPWS